MLMVLLFIVPKVMASVNIALGKQALLCEVTNLPSGLLDGITNVPVQIVDVKKTCKLGTLVIDIVFGDSYFVHYVVLHPGASEVDRRFVTYYKVTYFVDSVPLDCSQIPEPYNILGFDHGVRMNCRVFTFPVSNLFVTFLGFQNISLGEIEIHTLASGEPKTNVLFYRGCFSYFYYLVEISLTDFNSCWKRCQNFSLMGIKFFIEGNKSCHCGSGYEFIHEITLETCYLSCSVSDRLCGGDYSYSVYVVNLQLPFYHGCSNEGPPHVTINMADISIAQCLHYCDRANFMWVKGTTCGCTDLEFQKDVNPLKCNLSCAGEPNDICGGKERASVYGTCRHPILDLLSCQKLFQCSLMHNKYGECLGGCEEGFGGQYCIERVTNEGLRQKWSTYSIILLIIIWLVILFKILVIAYYSRKR